MDPPGDPGQRDVQVWRRPDPHRARHRRIGAGPRDLTAGVRRGHPDAVEHRVELAGQVDVGGRGGLGPRPVQRSVNGVTDTTGRGRRP